MLTTVLPLLLIITARAGTCAGLCVLENGTRARCQALEDIRYIETYDLEPLKAHVREPILRSSTVFANFTGLRHLDLSTGSLERIEAGSFLRLSNLRSLNLAENRIRDIETGSLDGLDRLHTLNLRGNRLRHLPPELARLKLLQHLDLQGNPLRCDCATLDTRDLLTARGVRFEGNVVCASPANSRGIPLLRLDAALVCRFEEQDLLGMQNDQADQSSYDSSGDSPGKRYDEDEKEEVLEELEEEEEEKEEEEEESTEIVETTIRAESETPFREIDSPPASTPFLEEVEPPSTLGDSSTPTSTEEVASKGESEPSKKTTAFASEKIHEDGLFYPTEGSGAEDEEEGEEEQGEGSGVEGSGSGPTSTHPSREGKGEDEGFSLFDGLYNIIWGTTEGTTNEGPDLEEEQFIDATPTKGEKEVEEEEEEEDKASTTSTTTTTTTTTVSSLSTEIILVPGVKFVDNSSKSGNVKMEEGEGDELASPTRQSKKGMGSYVVLAALLAILATLIGFAAYKGGFCRRRRKRGDVENGTELKDMQKALLETANTGAQAKVASNGNVESAPLVVDHPVDQTFDQDEIKVSNDCRVPDTGAKRSAVPRSPSRGGRSRRDSIDGGASREEDRVQQQPPLSPGAQRVKITVQENPDSVPKTPILITRTSNGENLVKTP